MTRLGIGLMAVCTLLLLTGPAWAQNPTESHPPAQNKRDILITAMHAAKARLKVSEHTTHGHSKMAAPTRLTCTPVDGAVIVNFEVVTDAGGYQVEYSCLDAAGLHVEESVPIEAPPTAEVPEECVVVLSVHVRATPKVRPRGLKGMWSNEVSCQAI